jgi:8-oxo-dGTP pyrophosphatase MutT (NUDIX family)
MLDQHDIAAPGKGVKERKEMWRQGRRLVYQWLLQLPEEYPSRWECLEFIGHLSYVGQRFLSDHDESIRVAPLLPGADVKESYYMEVFSGSRVFEQLSNAFDFMVNRSKPIAEWNICTTVRDDVIRFKGIINRSRRGKAREHLKLQSPDEPLHFPVVLVVLHAELGATRGILQERTPYNAASDFYKYSNISGSLVDQDIFRSLTPDGTLPDSTQYDAFVRRNYLAVQSNDRDASLDFLEATEGKVSLDGPIPADVMDRAWQLAAVRECYEELGLTVRRTRLVLQDPCVLLSQHHLDYNLVFRIFSLEITREEWDSIKVLRPRSQLYDLSWSEMETLYGEGRFNHLLQERFKDVFVSIYKRLGVAG